MLLDDARHVGYSDAAVPHVIRHHAHGWSRTTLPHTVAFGNHHALGFMGLAKCSQHFSRAVPLAGAMLTDHDATATGFRGIRSHRQTGVRRLRSDLILTAAKTFAVVKITRILGIQTLIYTPSQRFRTRLTERVIWRRRRQRWKAAS